MKQITQITKKQALELFDGSQRKLAHAIHLHPTRVSQLEAHATLDEKRVKLLIFHFMCEDPRAMSELKLDLITKALGIKKEKFIGFLHMP